jgi:hypothetical protein
MASSAYYRWVAAGRPARVARPVDQLQSRARSAGVAVLGVIGNTDHLTAKLPEDHTPFSATAWPVPLPGYVITAIDLADGPWMDRMLADARNGLLPWLKYLNFRRGNYSVKRGWQRVANSDTHGHVSIRSDHTYTDIGPYNPFTGATTGGTMAADQETINLHRWTHEVYQGLQQPSPGTPHAGTFGQGYWPNVKLTQIAAGVAALLSRDPAAISDAQVELLADRIGDRLVEADNPLDADDKPTIVEAVKQALREGTGATDA